MWNDIKGAWRKYPKVRMAARTLAVGVITYLVSEVGDGDIDDWGALGDAMITAAIYALAGIFTPLEPFVGPDFAKANNVTVPEPPANPTPAP
jgi:hypothetical protein